MRRGDAISPPHLPIRRSDLGHFIARAFIETSIVRIATKKHENAVRSTSMMPALPAFS